VSKTERMPRRWRAAAAALSFFALALPFELGSAGAQEPVTTCPDGVLCAGVGIADATWQVGAGAGQHAGETDGSAVTGGDADPHAHATKSENSYGVQSRLTMRALVLQGANGKRIVLLKSDNYLAQNYLLRRVGQLLADAGSSITADDILHSATHNHSSPYYSTPSFGVWVFEDVVDLRAFEYQARAIRDAILEGEANLRAARMGATSVEHDLFKSNVVGPAIADDGTPAGYPRDFGDNEIAVLRFDDASTGEPLAAWVNHGQHPESLDSYQLITADFLAPLERMLDDELGAPLVFSQGDVGSAEGPSEGRRNARTLPDGTVRAWYHTGFAQAERGARLLADSVVEGWNEIGAGGGTVPYSTHVPVELLTYWAPGPVSHPYPGVSACRTEPTAEGQVGVPNAADCNRDAPGVPVPLEWETLKAHGIPVPEGYDLPAYGAVEENNRLQLQAARIGEVLLGSCACEAQVDLILNFESRANDVTGDIWDGYPWDQHCDANGDGTWRCAIPDTVDQAADGSWVSSDRSIVVSDAAYQRMKAQIHNDAAGWDSVDYAPYANAEPADPTQIKGNFTKEELGPDVGFPLVVGLGHSGDYNGYTVSYREYVNRESYRKALTAYGAHTADYMVTRLVRMGAALRTGEPFVPNDPMTPVAEGDEARQEGAARALGAAAGMAYDAWLAALPDDAGAPAVVRQPTSITRFDAATVEWVGGSNAVDNPVARVERLEDGVWVPFASQHGGEVQTMVEYPQGLAGIADTYAGRHEWHWTASFEAFDAAPARLGQTPTGTYRFVLEGHHRSGGETQPYSLVSEAFDVTPWTGITISDLAVADGDVSFAVDPITYPRTYESPLRFLADNGNPNAICKQCSFRPWARTGEVETVTVDVIDDGVTVRTVDAALVDGRWVADTDLAGDEVASIGTGNVVDTWGEINGTSYVIAADGSVPAQVVALGGGASAEVDLGGGPSLPISTSRTPAPVFAAGALALAVLLVIARKVIW